jgi:ABC-type branched-subunit amino acid transport system ATPase component
MSRPPTGAALEVRNVEVVYDGVIVALRSVSLAVRTGEIVAAAGRVGAARCASG